MLYKQIILEWGQDTESGVWGLGYSPDNGKNFYVLNTTHGRKYRAEDGNRLYPYISDQVQDKIETVVAPAESAANSAVAYANDAVEKSKVNSQAIDDINSAVSDAKQGANDAMSRAKSAWDVAIGAKSAVTDFDPLLKSAQSDASKALTQIADTANALSDAKTAFTSDVAVAKNLANTAQATADSAVKSASSVADDLTAVANQAKANANGITKVTSDVGLLKTTVADNSGNISTIQETAKQIQQAVSDNAGNITVAKQTADSAVAVASDAKSNATVAIQTASQASITASNASGQAASAVLTANGAMTTASDAKSNATVAVQTASGASLTAINANSDATVAKQTASEAKVQASNAESDFAQLSIRAGQIEASVATNSGAIASVQQTANGLTTTVGNVDDRVKKIEDTTNWTTKTGALDMNTLTTTQNIYYRDSNLKNADGEAGWAYIQVVSTGERVTQTVWHDRSSIQHTRTGAIDGSTYDWDAWNKVATNAQVVQVKDTIDGISTTINDPKTGLNATYQTAAGNATTISNVKSDVYQLQTTANGLTSRVGNLESKTNTQETAIEQNKAAIALKADQTTVDTIKGTVNQNTATLATQANQIQTKVSASDVSGMLTGYATQTYTQSLITQKANEWNLNLTSLQTDVNAIKTTGGGVNLLQGTRDFSGIGIQGGKVAVTNGVEQFQAAFGTQSSSQSYFDLVDFTSVPLKKDTDYTASFWVKTSEDTDIASFLFDSGSNGAYNDGYTKNHSTTDYTRFVVHFHNGNNNATPNFIPARINKAGVTVWVYGCMLEEGTVAHTWSPAPSDMATVTSVTNLSATVDGIKGTVATKADQSTVTQLSNLIQDKVSSGDFTSTTTQLKNLINQRVQVGDVISQINQEAGGDTLIQVSNGKKSLILDAGNTVFTGKAWIPVAAIANLTADQIQAGTLSGSKVHAGDNSGNAIDMGALSTDYVGFHAYANNGDNTYIDLNGIHNYGASYDTRIQQGKITTNYLTVNGGGMIDFRDSNGTGMVAQGSTLTFDIGNTPAGYLSYNGMPVAEIPDGSGGNELAIRYGLSAAIIPNDNSGAQATFSGAAQKIGYMTGTNQGKQMLSGLEVHSNNHHWFGAVNSDATWNRIEINSNDGVNLAWHDQTHFWISDGKAKLYKDNNDSQTATELEVHGWAWVNGWVEAAGHSQHSTLSSKTRIEEADPDYMLDLVNNTDLTTFAFKSEVAEGLVVRHIGPIIDDVNDVAQYRTPAEFIAPTKTARDDDNMIGALFGAVQALTKRIKKLEDKLNG